MLLKLKDRETQRIWAGGRSRRLPPWIHVTALRRLRMLNTVSSLAEIAVFRGCRLESLQGDRLGQFSVRINDQWRICFRWTQRGPTDVEIVDYHA